MKPRIQLRELTDQERQDLEQLAGSRTVEARLVERARIVLAAALGRRPSAIARDLGKQVLVHDGLKAGDLVVLNPMVDLADGAKVAPQPEPANS